MIEILQQRSRWRVFTTPSSLEYAIFPITGWLMIAQKERRQFTRFRPKEGTMAVSHHVLGPVINISMAGLAFRYMNETANKTISDMLGIFLGSDNILIEELTTKVISDNIVSNGSTFLQTSTRQRSIAFINLTKTQRVKLEDFISNKTMEMY